MAASSTVSDSASVWLCLTQGGQPGTTSCDSGVIFWRCKAWITLLSVVLGVGVGGNGGNGGSVDQQSQTTQIGNGNSGKTDRAHPLPAPPFNGCPMFASSWKSKWLGQAA